MCKPIENDSHVDVLGALSYACQAFPTMRVGQIIDNALVSYYGSDGPGLGSADVFNVDNATLVKALVWYRQKFQMFS